MSEQETTMKATLTTPAEREIRTERIFDAPRDRVFAAYTDPALIPEWWGPEGTAPERIVQTFEWSGMPGYVSLETATFEDLGEQTRIVSVSVFYAGDERDGMLESGMEKGLNETYDKLEALLARQG